MNRQKSYHAATEELSDAIECAFGLVRAHDSDTNRSADVLRACIGKNTELIAIAANSAPGTAADKLKYVQVRGRHKVVTSDRLHNGLHRFYQTEATSEKCVRIGLDNAATILKYTPRNDIGGISGTMLCIADRRMRHSVVEKAYRALSGNKLQCERVMEAYGMFSEIGEPSLIVSGESYSLSVLNGTTPVVDVRNVAARKKIELLGDMWSALTNECLLEYEWEIAAPEESRPKTDRPS